MMRSRYNTPRFLAATLALAMLLFACKTAQAFSAVPRSFDELVALAELVVVGTVAEKQSRYGSDAQAHSIFTDVTLRNLSVVKGAFSAEEYVLRVSGGIVGDVAEMYPGLPSFEPGQRYVLFIRGNQRDFFPVVGITQGVFRVVADPQGVARVIPEADLIDHNPAKLLRALRMTGQDAEPMDAFLQRIRDRLPQ